MEHGRKPTEDGALAVKADESEQPPRREFVEPQVSFPVDVLEATTFFQLTDSGSTN
ncbi:MAG TPA: hypothetical protein VLJ61_07410 [Pyrinomonadaceae bacterium]|nr:hypothetical protein [Pyrinomonadaceae bacterium]